MRQPKISTGFAVSVIAVVGIFFATLIILMEKTKDLGVQVIEKGASRSQLENKEGNRR